MVCLFNPLTTTTTILLDFSGVPGLEGEPEVTTAGIVVDRRNVLDGDPIIVANMVVVVRNSCHLGIGPQFCALSDGHCGTVDAGIVEVEDGHVRNVQKPDLVGMGVVGEGVGVGDGALLSTTQ